MKTVAISISTKKKLDQIKDKYNFSTYDICAEKIVDFILVNKVDLNDYYIGDYKKSIIDLKIDLQKMIDENRAKDQKKWESLRKWLGAMERDYFKPTNTKMGVVHEITVNNETAEKLENPQIEEKEELVNSPKEESPVVIEKGVSNDEYKKAIEKSQQFFNELRTLKSSVRSVLNKGVEKSSMLGKKTVELSIEDWNELKQLVS